MNATGTATQAAPGKCPLTSLVEWLRPPSLPAVSARAFRFHMTYTLLDAMFSGIIGNVPLMAVKAMEATAVQLQAPLSMAALGMFASLVTGAAMARRRKKSFVLVPGFAGGVSTLIMSWMPTAVWFLFFSGVISIFDFAMRPAVPSIVRIVYPPNIRAHISGTLRRYASILFLIATLGSAAFLGASGTHVLQTIRLELTFAGLASIASYFCFSRLPDRGDGSAEEAEAVSDERPTRWQSLAPFRNRSFRKYIAIFFVYAFANLFHAGVVPAFLAQDMQLSYVAATVLMHVIPNLAAFAFGGRLTEWFDRTSIWRSYSFVALLWGLDPVVLAPAPSFWPGVIAARIMRGPATLGSMVLCFFTGVHSFAKPGSDTSRYMATLLWVNGVAKAHRAHGGRGRTGLYLAPGRGDYRRPGRATGIRAVLQSRRADCLTISESYTDCCNRRSTSAGSESGRYCERPSIQPGRRTPDARSPAPSQSRFPACRRGRWFQN